MMTDIHKHRDTHESFFFFLEEKHQRIDTCTVFSFCFDRDQLANVLQNDWKEHLKIKKKKVVNFVCYRRLFGWGAGSCLHFGIEKINTFDNQ